MGDHPDLTDGLHEGFLESRLRVVVVPGTRLRSPSWVFAVYAAASNTG